jgi:hypothetical protein
MEDEENQPCPERFIFSFESEEQANGGAQLGSD